MSQILKTRKGIVFQKIGKKVRELSALLNISEMEIKKMLANDLEVETYRVRRWCSCPDVDPGIEIVALASLFFTKNGLKTSVDDLIDNKLLEIAEDLNMALPNYSPTK